MSLVSSRVSDAFDKPTLRLLDRKWAPLVLAVFRLSFTRDQRSVPAERLHAQVDTYLESSPPRRRQASSDATGRALCMQWMKDQWLFRTIGDSGAEEYTLTSHALEALDLVATLSRERALISESRINTILDAVRRVATEANPDRQARIDRLDAQIAQLTAERDRLAAGGEVARPSTTRCSTATPTSVALIGQLPSDFKRVEEVGAGDAPADHRDFRSEDRPIAEVLDRVPRQDRLADDAHRRRARVRGRVRAAA